MNRVGISCALDIYFKKHFSHLLINLNPKDAVIN